MLPDASGVYFSNAAGLPSGAVVDVSATGDAFIHFTDADAAARRGAAHATARLPPGRRPGPDVARRGR